MDRLDLFVCIDSDDGQHDVPDTFLPAPTYFVRSAEKLNKTIPRLQAESGSEDVHHLRLVASIKAAMGRELTRGCERYRWTASMSQQATDEWDQILDLDM